MKSKKIFVFILLKIFILLIEPSLKAGSFNVNPVHVHLSKDQKIESLTVTNHEPTPLTVHLQVKEWKQEASQDIYKETNDLLMAPPIVTIKPKSSQIVRVALKEDPDAQLEKTYRLYISEVPSSESVKNQKGLQLALKLSLPIFVEPLSGILDEPPFEISPQGNQLRFKNKGRQHGFISSIMVPGLTREPFKVFHYVLSQQDCLIPFPQASSLAGRRVIVEINHQKRTLDVSKEAEIPISPRSSSRAGKNPARG